MRFSIDIPEALSKAMREAAHQSEYKSVSEWARHVLALAAGVEIDKVNWGGAKETGQVEEVHQVDGDDELDLPPAKPSAATKQKATMRRADSTDEPEYIDIVE